MPTKEEVFEALKYHVEVDVYDTRRYYNSAGELHREDGPAVIRAVGTKEWYHNGLHHREDGPAVEFPSGMHKWCLNGIVFSQQRYYKRLAELGIANDH